MRLLIALLFCLCFSGCAALKERAADYIQEEAIEQISKAVDKQLEKRGLSLDELKQFVDENKDGNLGQDELLGVAKATAKDFIELQIQQKSGDAQKQLEQKIAALAEAKDLDELKKVAEEQDLFGKGTMGTLMLAILGVVYQRINSAKRHGAHETELAAQKTRMNYLEKLFNRDLDGDGSVGGGGGEVA